MYVIMVAMVVVMPTSLLILYATIMERRGVLLLTLFLLVIAWILEFVGAIVICLYGVEESDVLTDQLKEVFFSLIYSMDYNPRSSRILRIVQEYVRIFFQCLNLDHR